MSTLRPLETDLTRFYALFPQPALARDLFNIVEGHRVDAAIRRAYPGIRRDMAADPGAPAPSAGPSWPPSPTPRRWSRRSCSTPWALVPDLRRAGAGDPGPDRRAVAMLGTVEAAEARASATRPA